MNGSEPPVTGGSHRPPRRLPSRTQAAVNLKPWHCGTITGMACALETTWMAIASPGPSHAFPTMWLYVLAAGTLSMVLHILFTDTLTRTVVACIFTHPVATLVLSVLMVFMFAA